MAPNDTIRAAVDAAIQHRHQWELTYHMYVHDATQTHFQGVHHTNDIVHVLSFPHSASDAVPCFVQYTLRSSGKDGVPCEWSGHLFVQVMPMTERGVDTKLQLVPSRKEEGDAEDEEEDEEEEEDDEDDEDGTEEGEEEEDEEDAEEGEEGEDDEFNTNEEVVDDEEAMEMFYEEDGLDGIETELGNGEEIGEEVGEDEGNEEGNEEEDEPDNLSQTSDLSADTPPFVRHTHLDQLLPPSSTEQTTEPTSAPTYAQIVGHVPAPTRKIRCRATPRSS